MERRKFLIGAGSLAAGSAAAMSTGAFTSVQADRTVNVNVANDSNALLALTTDPDGDGNDESANAAYVTTNGGQATVNLNSDASPTGGGSGINADSLTQINDLFRVVNQGTQAAVVYVDPESIGSSNRTEDSGSGIKIDPQATSRPNGDYTKDGSLESGAEEDQISLTGSFEGPAYSAYDNDGDGNADDALEEFVLEPGESFEFGLYVKADDTVDSDSSLSETMEIVADATRVPDDYVGKDD